jgi:hypothetical protein
VPPRLKLPPKVRLNQSLPHHGLTDNPFITAKDLSHVPCKFFKVGSCTAGSSCPFSHHVQEPGQQKDVCAWFVKGNCKFGHKCALAHVLPGQSMAMDKKNKKAAQIAAAANSPATKDGSKLIRNQKRDPSSSQTSATNRNPLLSGSTAPTGVLPPSARPPMTMPLSISPSAPARPLKDTDFTSFDLSDEPDKLHIAPAKGIPSTPPPVLEILPEKVPELASGPQDIPYPKPPSTPLAASVPRQLTAPHHPSHSADFGPIGSPTRPSQVHASAANGFSPGTSPNLGQSAGFPSTSPFSAPGPQSFFLSYDRGDRSPSDFKTRSGIAASLGAHRNWNGDMGGSAVPSKNKHGSENEKHMRLAGEIALEDEDFEEFLPGSLTDLLTPEERSRRMSRTTMSSTSTAAIVMPVRNPSAAGANHLEGSHHHHHRYSRSVPAPSLLSDIKSIWADREKTLPSFIDTAGQQNLTVMSAFPSGTPSSFKSSSAFGGRSFGEDVPSLLAPSNASAAFLPGIHRHYLNSKSSGTRQAAGAQGLHSIAPGSAAQTTSSNNPLAIPTSSTTATTNGPALSTSRVNASGNLSPFDVPPEPLYPKGGSFARAIPLAGGGGGSGGGVGVGVGVGGGVGVGALGGGNGPIGDLDERRNALSPSTRALQAHAPGQSLPQGLAAGYSRIHALPPPPSVVSPTSGLSSGALSEYHQHQRQSSSNLNVNGQEWSSSLELNTPNQHGGSTLDGMLSRLSSYVVTPTPVPTRGRSSLLTSMSGQTQATTTRAGPRSQSGIRWSSQGGPLSPPSLPEVTVDDDELFSMDG